MNSINKYSLNLSSFENLLNQTQRRNKINKLKKKFSKQLIKFKAEAESGNINQNLMDQVDIFKQNILKINNLIEKYNHIKEDKQIEPLTEIDWKSWKTNSDIVLNHDDISNIGYYLDFRSLARLKLVSKLFSKAIKCNPLLKIRANIGYLEGYLRNNPFWIPLGNPRKLISDQRYDRLFKVFQEYNALIKTPLDMAVIASDLMVVSHGYTLSDPLANIILHIKAMAILGKTWGDKEILYLMELAEKHYIKLSLYDATKILANPDLRNLQVELDIKTLIFTDNQKAEYKITTIFTDERNA
jgi:hypothetical protein